MRAPFAFLAILLAPVALAGDPVTAPKPGSVEETVRSSLQLIRDGKYDDWFSNWCEPIRCSTQEQKDDLLRFALARAHNDAAKCLHGDGDGVIVTRVKGDPAADAQVTVYVQCEEGRLPTPSTLTKVDGKWKVTSFSW